MPYIPRSRPAAPGENPDNPAELTSSDLNSAVDVPSEKAGSHRSRRVVITVVLGLAAVVLDSLATWATVAAHRLRAELADANVALVDQAATRKVSRDVTNAVNTIFSYNYADTAQTRVAAQRLLTGAAIRQYNVLFALVE